MVLTVSFALSPVTGLCCHRRLRILPRSLTPASGRQDHTTSPSALASLVLRRSPRPPHPAPTSVTIAIRPSYGCGMCESIKLFLPNREAKYFLRRGLDSEFAKQPVGQISRANSDVVPAKAGTTENRQRAGL